VWYGPFREFAGRDIKASSLTGGKRHKRAFIVLIWWVGCVGGLLKNEKKVPFWYSLGEDVAVPEEEQEYFEAQKSGNDRQEAERVCNKKMYINQWKK